MSYLEIILKAADFQSKVFFMNWVMSATHMAMLLFLLVLFLKDVTRKGWVAVIQSIGISVFFIAYIVISSNNRSENVIDAPISLLIKSASHAHNIEVKMLELQLIDYKRELNLIESNEIEIE